MNDLQTKFAMTIILIGLFFSMFIPKWNELKKMHDDTLDYLSQPVAPAKPIAAK